MSDCWFIVLFCFEFILLTTSPLATTCFSVGITLFLTFVICFFFRFYTSEVIWHLYFSVWFISLSIKLSSSIHAVAKNKISFFLRLSNSPYRELPGGSVVENLPVNAGDAGSIPRSGRSPGEGNGNPVQYSCLENPTDRGARWATVRGVTKQSDTA